MTIYKCHYVSRLLLKQFSKNDKVRRFEKRTNFSCLKFTSDVGYINLPEDYFNEIERKWGRKIEQKVANLIQKYGSNPEKFIHNDEALKTFKNFMALLFTRSIATFNLLARYAKLEEERLIKDIPHEYHSYIRSEWKKTVLESAPKIIDDIYMKIKKDLDQYTLEVAKSRRRTKFILGDIPVISTMKDVNGKNYIGVHEGVAFNKSETFVLPITPDYALSVFKAKKIWSLSTRDIRAINKKCKYISRNEYYCRPD